MIIGESIRIALRALHANRLRSSLTMLGIIIGVASVVTMGAVGAGAQAQIMQEIRSLGANLLMVQPGTINQGGARLAGGTSRNLSESDALAIADAIPLIEVAAPSVRDSAQIVHGNRNWNTMVNGTTADYFVAREWLLAEGRYFSDEERGAIAKVALIGRTVADQLFGTGSPVGRRIRIQNTPFEVIGVLAEKGPSGSGRDQDDIVFVPITTAKLRLTGSAQQINREAVDYILVKAVSDEAMEPAGEQIRGLLRQRHRLRPGQEDDFRVSNPEAAMNARREAGQTISWLLAAIASVSLAVGGISIMNIMLVSVTERTREIGLRLSVGARPKDVRNQFIIEAVTLCLLGGVAGILFGILCAILVAKFSGWPVFISPSTLLFAVGFAGAVGLFFGYYPALKASRMDPIQALRFE